MIVTYRGYEHQAKESNFRVTSTVLRTQGDYAYAVHRRIEQNGCIMGSDQPSLISNIEALMAAYSLDGGDYVVRFNDGTPTPDINILSRDCIGGVRVINRPSLDPKGESEYSNYWHYSIALEAMERLSSGTSRVLVDFEETLDYEGDGGPKRVLLEMKYGPAQAQIARTHTKCRLMQKGHVTFLNSRPGPNDIPPPLFPAYRDPEATRISKPHPKRLNGTLVEWRVDYSYVFESATPFPNIEPNLLK